MSTPKFLQVLPYRDNGIAADWIEEHSETPFAAIAIRQNLYHLDCDPKNPRKDDTDFGDGYGYGYGRSSGWVEFSAEDDEIVGDGRGRGEG